VLESLRTFLKDAHFLHRRVKMVTNNHTNEADTADPVAVSNGQHIPRMLNDIIPIASEDDNVDYDPQTDSGRRRGTIFSARFNIWSTMVGGGSLSLPLAFAKTGNALVAPTWPRPEQQHVLKLRSTMATNLIRRRYSIRDVAHVAYLEVPIHSRALVRWRLDRRLTVCQPCWCISCAFLV
jgi:hypothetical protein